MPKPLPSTAWRRFLEWCTPPEAPPSLARQHRIVGMVLCIFIAVALAFVLPCWMLGYTGTTMGHGAAILVGLCAMGTLRRWGPVVAAHLTALACCATLVPYITLAGGFDYPFLFWFLIVPLCAGLLGGQRVGVIWSGITSAIVLVYTLLPFVGIHLPAREMIDPPAVLVVSQALTLVFMVGATMYIFQENQLWEELQTRRAIEKLEVEVAERRAAEAAAQEANRAKSSFLAMMSHELRTPMNGVLGMTQLLLLAEQSPDERRYTEALRDSGELLMGLLDSLLDFAKIESGHIELESRVFSLVDVLRSASTLMRGRAEEKHLELFVELEPELPTLVWGDELRLRQIVHNLLSNAIKFTERGSVGLYAGPTERGTVSIRIVDTGIGIPSDAQSHLFEAFTQADTATTRKYGGTGLGLAIVASLAEAMGGRVEVVSALGEGSVFTLDLPLEEATSLRAPAPEPTPSLAGSVRVLVVEDNPVNRLVAERFLLELDCEVEAVEDGQSAVELLQSREFEIVLMDMHMPVMDGLEATREIRRQHGGELPVIGLTASVTATDREACLEAGMNDVLCKPIVMDALRETLHRHGRGHERAVSSDQDAREAGEEGGPEA